MLQKPRRNCVITFQQALGKQQINGTEKGAINTSQFVQNMAVLLIQVLQSDGRVCTGLNHHKTRN